MSGRSGRPVEARSYEDPTSLLARGSWIIVTRRRTRNLEMRMCKRACMGAKYAFVGNSKQGEAPQWIASATQDETLKSYESDTTLGP